MKKGTKHPDRGYASSEKELNNLQQTRNITLLLADDDYVNYLYFSELINHPGLHLDRAVSLSQLLFKLKTDQGIGVLMLSYSFASQFNCRLSRYLKKKFPCIPQILILEDRIPEEQRDILLEGCDTFIHKHIDQQELLEAIAELLVTNTPVRIS